MHSNDGLKDALTNLVSPTLLYEELRRELARAKRSGASLCAMKIVMRQMRGTPEADSLRVPGVLSEAERGIFRRSSHSDREVLVFAKSLMEITRAEDICARMGEFEFLVLLQGIPVSQQVFGRRLVGRWRQQRDLDRRLKIGEHPTLDISFAISDPLENSLSLLNRLDGEEVEVYRALDF